MTNSQALVYAITTTALLFTHINAQSVNAQSVNAPQLQPQRLNQPTVRIADASHTNLDAYYPERAPMQQALREPVIPSQPAQTEQVAHLFTLAEAESFALQNNPTIAQAQANVQAERGQWVQAGLYPNPNVSYQGNEIGDSGKAGQQGFFVSQQVVVQNKLGLNRQVALQSIRKAEQILHQQEQKVLTDVRAQFYAVLAAQRLLKLAEQMQHIGQESVRTVEKLIKIKERSRVDFLQARVESNRIGVLVQNVQQRHQAAWRELTAVMGTPQMELREVQGDLGFSKHTIAWEAALAKLLEESPLIAQAMFELEQARWKVQLAYAGRRPDPTIGAGVAYDYGDERAIANLQISVPITIHNRNQGNILAAEAELRAAKQNIERLNLQLQQQLAKVYGRYQTAYQKAKRYQLDILKDSEETLRLTTLGYENGQFEYLRLLTAQRTYFEINVDYVESLLELWDTQFQIEGYLQTGGLNAPMRE